MRKLDPGECLPEALVDAEAEGEMLSGVACHGRAGPGQGTPRVTVAAWTGAIIPSPARMQVSSQVHVFLDQPVDGVMCDRQVASSSSTAPGHASGFALR